MADIPLDRRINLVEQRCWDCGRFWACEQWGQGANRGTCPWCAGVKRAALVEALRRSDRVIAALKGVVRRRRRG